MSTVFLSYASQDQAFVDRIEPLLRERGVISGADYVIDPQREIEAGCDPREATRKRLMDAGKVVILNTPASATSPWVNYEAGMASALGKPIVLVHLHGSENSLLAERLGDVPSIELDPIV